jgi:Domain of unknown function (DUF222)
VVVGGSRGVGLAVAELLAVRGAGVVVNGRDRDVVDAAAQGIPGAVAHPGSPAAPQIADALIYRCISEFGETEDWAVDTTEVVASEVAAELRISQGMAISYLRYARAMREQLAQSGAVFRAGDIDFLLFQTLVYRTDLITDRDVLAAVDAELALAAPRWPSMTRGRPAAQVDKIVWRATGTRCGGAEKPSATEKSGSATVMTDSPISRAPCSRPMRTPSASVWPGWPPRYVTLTLARQSSAARTRWAHWPAARIGWIANAARIIARRWANPPLRLSSSI